MDDRGQTLTDYTFGISIFLLTVITVIILVPTLFTPFTAPIRAEQSVQADRLNGQILADLSENGTENVLNSSRTGDFFNTSTESSIRATYGLPRTADVNVTLLINRTGSTTTALRAGDSYGEQAVGSALRIVTGYDGFAGACRPSCRLVVRVW